MKTEPTWPATKLTDDLIEMGMAFGQALTALKLESAQVTSPAAKLEKVTAIDTELEQIQIVLTEANRRLGELQAQKALLISKETLIEDIQRDVIAIQTHMVNLVKSPLIYSVGISESPTEPPSESSV